MVEVIKDIDLMPHVEEYDVVLIGTNLYGSLSQGIQRDIALNYPYVRNANLETRYGDVSRLGSILECKEINEPTITLVYIIRGFPYRKSMDEDYLDYGALEKCLKEVNKKYKGKRLATTLLGCSRFDGNGDREKVMEIMNRVLTDVDMTVYDFYQKSRDEKLIEIFREEGKLRAIDYSLYHDAVKKRKEEAEKRFKRNGFARY